MGMNEAFAKLGVEQRRAEEEQAFVKWVNEKKNRQKKYGTALDDINQAVAERAPILRTSTYLRETLANIELMNIASSAASFAADMSQAMPYIDRFYKDYSPSTDRKVTKRMIEIYRDSVAAEFHPEFFKTIENDFGGDVKAFVDDLFDKSVFASREKLDAVLAGENAAETLAADPAAKMFESVMGLYMGLTGGAGKISKQLQQGHKAYIGGQMEMNKGKAMYPDANFTMRLTYGTVKSYSPKDGVVYDYYTTLKGVMEKEDPDNWEFVVPSRLKDLYKAGDFGQYARPDGTMPACFIMTGDITGGNSGSPVLDGEGNLIGLAFDGNWESMSGDIIFEPDLQRCICVDIRYVLFIIDKFGGCGRLIDEMNIIS